LENSNGFLLSTFTVLTASVLTAFSLAGF